MVSDVSVKRRFMHVQPFITREDMSIFMNYYYSHIFPESWAQLCNYATLLAGRSTFFPPTAKVMIRPHDHDQANLIKLVSQGYYNALWMLTCIVSIWLEPNGIFLHIGHRNIFFYIKRVKGGWNIQEVI